MSRRKPPTPPRGRSTAKPIRVKATKQDYQVGYGRPPEATRFKPGQSGNPKGRAKGAISVGTQVTRILSSKIPVTEKGVSRKMTLQEVMLRSVATNAAKGDLKSIGFLLRLEQQYHDDFTSSVIDPQVLDDDDQALIKAFLEGRESQGDSCAVPDSTESAIDPDNPDPEAIHEPAYDDPDESK